MSVLPLPENRLLSLPMPNRAVDTSAEDLPSCDDHNAALMRRLQGYVSKDET